MTHVVKGTFVIPAKAGIQRHKTRAVLWQRRKAKVLSEIPPIRIVLLKQAQFPVAVPFFDPLFPHDGVLHRGVLFKPHECFNAVAASEALKRAFTMLINAGEKV